MKALRLVCPLLLAAFVASGQQPAITAVVNAASYLNPNLPNGSIAQGALFVAFGKNLGPATLSESNGFPLRTSLSGTSVQITVGGTTINAPMVYALGTQICGLIPSRTPVGSGTIAVTYNGQTSAPAPITIVASTFGTFTTDENGSGQGVVTYADYSMVTPAKSANAGETLIIWGTGAGAVSGDETAQPLVGDNRAWPLQVYVGGKLASVSYQGRSGCCAGLDQIVITVPPGVSGCAVPLVVRTGDTVSNTTTLAIATSGRECTPFLTAISGSPVQRPHIQGPFSQASVQLTRSQITSRVAPGRPATVVKSDDASASFTKVKAAPSSQNADSDIAPYGACLVTAEGSPTVGPAQTSLDAGASMLVTGPSGVRIVGKQSGVTGTSYGANLGNATTGNFLDPGTYTISSLGGADVGAVNLSVKVPAPLVWTNQDSISTVTRANGIDVTWTGGDPNGYVQITGSNNSAFTSASFNCTARTSDGSFTIPSYVLLALPASPTISGTALSSGSLSVNAIGEQVPVQATGIDFGRAFSSIMNGQSVAYR